MYQVYIYIDIVLFISNNVILILYRHKRHYTYYIKEYRISFQLNNIKKLLTINL